MTDTYTFNVAQPAAETIAKMRDHVARIGTYWGVRSEEYREALTSLNQQMTTLFGNPMRDVVNVYKDGEMSLFVESGIVFGVIWHAKKRHCTTEGCHAFIADDGSTSTWSVTQAPVLDHEHTPSFPLDAPHPGTWSFHS